MTKILKIDNIAGAHVSDTSNGVDDGGMEDSDEEGSDDDDNNDDDTVSPDDNDDTIDRLTDDE